ncbi:transcriptional regulator [Labedella phragmitis]|uniref:Transcriptional regulator n=1 Tax=Labedella phragmitis TaxID=2498849 RepID=A0A444PY61_9MICO|nr:helix-turn-helix domain-containing protein [Labedella phragmitis]RWZ52783.1 transcriptional regulator [Labedella phragmitis]
MERFIRPDGLAEPATLGSLLSGPGTTDGVFPVACPTRVVLDHVTSKWGVLVIVALAERSLRWGELRRGVEGISEKMLAQTLKLLESDGFVLREAQPTIPPRVDYSLTPLGEELASQLLPLVSWIADNTSRILPTP